jgi:Flp pilus assembly protein TadD
MTMPLRTTVALTALATASVLAGCASPGTKASLGTSDGRTAAAEVGTATRALAALQSGDHASAVRFAELAVERAPNDAGMRTLLGDAYLAAGRFASAETTYQDSLALLPGQPGIALKTVLAAIAQGKQDAALARLDELRSQIDAADAGLAMALAGQPGNAIAVLDEAARAPDADGRVRQNLALAHALAGNWDSARAIAAQDLPADQLDARMADWMALGRPGSTVQQVATLIGVQPAASDPGQPVRLALRTENVRMAEAQAPAAPSQLVETQPAPLEVAAVEPAPEVQPAYVAPEVEPLPAPVAVAAAEPAFITPAPIRSSRLPKPQQLHRSAAARFGGTSMAVVQLGAYGSPARVQAAWASASRRFASLKRYTPASARFASAKGTFYRLSLKGFGSDREARLLCESLKRSGSACFVRNVAGDTPVRFAAR